MTEFSFTYEGFDPQAEGLREVRFGFDFEGTKCVAA